MFIAIYEKHVSVDKTTETQGTYQLTNPKKTFIVMSICEFNWHLRNVLFTMNISVQMIVA